jgi:hypothetical protein
VTNVIATNYNTVGSPASTLFSTAGTITTLTATTGNILNINTTTLGSTTGNIVTVNSTNTNSTNYNTVGSPAATLYSDAGTITTLASTTGNIATVNATTVGATTGNIATVNATTVGATTGNITTVNATTANSSFNYSTHYNTVGSPADTIYSTNGTITTLASTTGNITTVNATTLNGTNAIISGTATFALFSCPKLVSGNMTGTSIANTLNTTNAAVTSAKYIRVGDIMMCQVVIFFDTSAVLADYRMTFTSTQLAMAASQFTADWYGGGKMNVAGAWSPILTVLGIAASYNVSFVCYNNTAVFNSGTAFMDFWVPM